MARARNSGGVASVWALAIFGIGFFICLLLSIVLYTKLGDAQQRAADAEQTLRQFVTADEQKELPAVLGLASDRSAGTVVGALLDQNSTLRGRITSDQNVTLESLDAQLQKQNINGPLLREIEAIRAELKAREQELEQTKQNLANAQKDVAAAKQQQAALSKSYSASEQTMQKQVQAAAKDALAHQESVKKMEADLLAQIEQNRRGLEQRVAELQRETGQLQQERQALENQLADALRQGGGVSVPDVILADGRIASVLSDGNKVYINRGRADRVVLGMTFEVYDEGVLVRPSQDSLRGKATLELIDVQQEWSIARVVRKSRGAVLAEGDQIINIAYDPDATYKFYVYGQFDLENTGEPTLADRDRIEGIVRQWGGKLTQDLSYDVDFLVLGAEPPLPDALPPGTIDPRLIQTHVTAMENYENYQSLITRAQSLDIPVLNQNRLLMLVGYYQR